MNAKKLLEAMTRAGIKTHGTHANGQAWMLPHIRSMLTELAADLNDVPHADNREVAAALLMMKLKPESDGSFLAGFDELVGYAEACMLQALPEPVSDTAIASAGRQYKLNAETTVSEDRAVTHAFRAGARWAEFVHGIGGKR